MTAIAHDRRALARQMILDHACSSEAEREAVGETLRLLDAPADPFDRTTAPGHVTGSAIVLDDARERVLVVWHAGLQRWLQPGGHSEPDDDSPLSTAVRELAEETGLTIHPTAGTGRLVHVDVHPIPARGAEPVHFHHDFRFAFVIAPRILSPSAADHDVAWIDIDAMETVAADASLRTAVACALREVG